MKTIKKNNFTRHPEKSSFPQKLPRYSGSGLSYFIDLVFGLCFKLVKLSKSQRTILRRDDPDLSDPFCVDTQPLGPHPHAPKKDLLPISTQQPVDETLGRIGMRLILENRDMTIAATNVE